ncbi:MAG: 1-acyl-sn-glycerol-3-phosphate acyltransferase [Pseudonocardiales bacterium]|nr:1-acyl-sn-glycerol-3-phosphate acyltransferase [Pseudonocardiales bacterium]
MPRQAKRRRLGGPGKTEKRGALWRVVWLVFYGPVSALCKIRYRNLEGIPEQGPAIIVVNHVSHVDPFLVGKMIMDAGRTPRFLAKDGIFAVPVVGAAMRQMGHIPVRRGTAEARHSFDAAVDALRNGRLLVMHPEGTVTRDPDGWPMIGKSGAARLALLAPEVPVIPIAQWGVQNSIDLYRKKVRLFPRPRHELAVGTPINLDDYRSAPLDAKTLRVATELIMRRLRADVAQLRGLPVPTGDLYYWVRPSKDVSRPTEADP